MQRSVVAQVPAALATSAPEARVRAALQGGGLDELFVAVVTGEDVSRGRPDPEPYLLAAQQIGRPPVRCVIIGNSNQVGRRKGRSVVQAGACCAGGRVVCEDDAGALSGRANSGCLSRSGTLECGPVAGLKQGKG